MAWTYDRPGGARGFGFSGLHFHKNLGDDDTAAVWTANVEPSSRYVLSVPGSTQFRLHSDRSGFTNLYLAGDWTKVPDVNAGCVEVACMSGLAAAAALSGVDIPIVASDTLYTHPQFVNFGGWTALPPPPW